MGYRRLQKMAEGRMDAFFKKYKLEESEESDIRDLVLKEHLNAFKQGQRYYKNKQRSL